MTTTEKGSDMSATDMESVESFRERAREWLAANVEKGAAAGHGDYRRGETEEEELALIAQARELQKQVLRRRLRRHLLSQGVRRSGPLARAPARVQPGSRGLRVPVASSRSRRSCRARRCSWSSAPRNRRSATSPRS